MNPTGQLDDYRWLLSEEAGRWLRSAAAAKGQPLVAQASRLRKHLSAERVHLVLQQVELRRKARAKFFDDADRLFYTPVRLEQATDQPVARYKASRFPREQRLADLCCGIGGDLAALAGRGPTVGVDRDPIAALLAEANLRALGLGGPGCPRAEVQVADVAEFSVTEFAAWHLDPDRRAEGRRTTAIRRYEPGLATIRRLLRQQGDAAVKLAPAADPPEGWRQEAELEWISRARQCRQLVAWFGGLAEHPGRRRATILAEGESGQVDVVRTLVGARGVRAPVARQIGRYVFDPDTAVLAAGLSGTLAADNGLAAMARGTSYLTGDCAVADPALAFFEVTDVLPLDLKRLRRLLKARGIGRLEIKKRGLPHDLEALRRRLHLRGEGAAVLLLAPGARGVTAIVARRG